MRYLIIAAIQLYRKIVPPESRKRCLFRESCSAHVERVAREMGCKAAFRALIKRQRCCRPGYGFQFLPETHTWELVCMDGSRFGENELAAHIVLEYQTMKHLIEEDGSCQRN